MIHGNLSRVVGLLFGLAALAASPARADPLADSLVAMRMLDQRVANIGHRLATANLELCGDRRWLPGFAVHDLSQYGGDYRSAAIRAFGLGSGPAVLAVAETGPAARAGLRQDDVVVRLDGVPVPVPGTRQGNSDDHMEPLYDAIDQAFADGAAVVEVSRAGEPVAIRIGAAQGCASRFQVVPSRRANAYANGTYVRVTTPMVGHAADDQELAWLLAHEFAHNVLRHRDRLDAEDVERGFLGNFGRSARLIRETEMEADRLSVYLLERAGFDPEAAIRFSSTFGSRGLNFLGSPTHPNWRRRMEMFRTEIAAIRSARARGEVPATPFPLPLPARGS